jgi:DNA-binding response OmpR family regulator
VSAAQLLVLGAEAEGLAPRLEASGYGVIRGQAGLAATPDPQSRIDLVVLAADQAERVGFLRELLDGVPILLDVGDDSLEGRVHCLSTGADDFWLSSLGPSDLLMRVRLQLDLRRRRMPPSPLLQIADLSLNPGNHEVKRGKRPVALTAREYQLLLLLLERQGTVVSREQIQRLVWNDDRGASSNVIEVYVRYLRQKLEEGGERRLIHTIRGRGYCLSERMPPLEAP